MRRLIGLLTFLLILPNILLAETKLTGKDIFKLYGSSVVQIWINGNFSGTGFLVSSNGLIITANHVVSSRASKFREFSSNIQVYVVGKPSPYKALVVSPDVENRINFDSAVLKIDGHGFNHLNLGDWNSIDIENDIFIIPNYPGFGTMLLTGTVSGRASAHTDFGPLPINVILFQSPVRNGFSGSPIFNSSGDVIGFVDTKMFGISADLASFRDALSQAQGGTSTVNGINLAGAFYALIINLDQNLISGLGSGVDISYAKEDEKKYEKSQIRT